MMPPCLNRSVSLLLIKCHFLQMHFYTTLRHKNAMNTLPSDNDVAFNFYYTIIYCLLIAIFNIRFKFHIRNFEKGFTLQKCIQQIYTTQGKYNQNN